MGCDYNCACGKLCSRCDDHGDRHVCANAWVCTGHCPRCGHHNLEHRGGDAGFMCNERMSHDNNDFCGCTHGAPEPIVPTQEPLAVFYAVRNDKGEYYRMYDKNRSTGWKKDLADAKLWTRIGPAKGKITALSHGKGPIPELVEFIVREVRVVDQRVRVAEAKRKLEEEEIKRQAAIKALRLQAAQSDYDRAKSRLEKLKGIPVVRVHGPDCGCKSCVGM